MVLLMSASGGVASGLGTLLIFTCAFGGGLVIGRISTALPAMAFILTIYDEFYLFFLDLSEEQSFFIAGLLGIAFFLANILFQYLARQLRAKESEVFALEQINQYVIEQMKTGVIVVSEDNEIMLINQSAEDLLTTPNLVYQTMSRLPYTLTDLLDGWRADHSKVSPTFHTYESGAELLATFSALAGSSESDTLIFLEDYSEIQQQAQQLKLAAVGRLSATIAHEVRNPLSAISHAAQLLSEADYLHDPDRRLTEIIQNHSDRTDRVIENVLQLSRRKTAEPLQIGLKQWLTQFVEEFTAGQPDEPIIEVEVTPPDSAVDVDPYHLEQALANLCENGLRYSQKNTGETRIRIVAGIDPTSNLPYIDVIDFGAGVAGEAVPNLFEPFYTTESTGTGLGLYISRELCEANQARISYARHDTGGSRFRISFI